MQSWLGSPWEIPSNYVWGTRQGLQDDFFFFLSLLHSRCSKICQAGLRQQLPVGSSPAHSSGREGFGQVGQSSLSHQGLLKVLGSLGAQQGLCLLGQQIQVGLWVCLEYFRLVKSTDAHGCCSKACLKAKTAH